MGSGTAELAENAKSELDRNRLRRMEEAWLLLAEGQDWLDGNISPEKLGSA